MTITFKQIVNKAVQEEIPSVDVTEKVIEEITSIKSVKISDYRIFKKVAIISSIAASLMLVSQVFISHQKDAVSEMIDYVSWVNVGHEE